ncbi:MAG: neocarzinostatin apoprotein domain-containing protein [Acidimicrobiia bacterium]
MLIPVLLVVLVVGAVAAAAVAAASGHGGTDRSFLGGAGPPLVLLGGAVGVVVLFAAAAMLVGLRGGGGGDAGDRPVSPRPPASVPAGSPPAPAPPAVEAGGVPDRPAGIGPDVAITSGARRGVVDRLPESAVLVVRARGFKPGTGEVAQCALDADGPRECVNRFPVQFDAGGAARFQYLVSDGVEPAGRCRAGGMPCLLIVFGPHGEAPGSVFTVFHDPAPPPGRIVVEPRAGLSDGDVVTVRASGFPPATRLVAAQCPPEANADPGRCRQAVSTLTDAGGGAVVRLTVRTGPVGEGSCGARQPCSVRVAAEAAVAPVTVPVAFTAGPSARYRGGRLAGGLALAGLLLVLAWWLFRTTDWGEPTAAATPEMDRAVLDA